MRRPLLLLAMVVIALLLQFLNLRKNQAKERTTTQPCVRAE